MKHLRVGLLGAGYILKSHARAVSAVEGATLHAVCDLSRGRAEASAAEFGIAHVHSSVEALAASDCDVVHILLPPAAHVPAARTLVEAGKHVFLEKPMGVSSAECRGLAGLATARGVQAGVNHNFLFAHGYQGVRDALRSGAMGAIDQLEVNWLYALPLLQFGPFNNWMVAAPGNLVFELGPHLAAFAVDLLGEGAEIVAASADNPLDIPGDQRVYRRWTAIGRKDRAGFTLTLSVAPGETERGLLVRAAGGIARFDLEKGIGWSEARRSDNPVFDNLARARGSAKAIGQGARSDFRRYLGRLLKKAPGANPFEESIAASVAAFYEGVRAGSLDARLQAGFGAEVIRLCEDVVRSARLPLTTEPGAPVSGPAAPARRPTVLVVGGSGFIGRRLVEKLAARGVGVRVLTRSVASAAIDLAGVPVELMQGSHGDPAALERALGGIEAVYHLAKAEGQKWDDYVHGDIEPTRRLAEAALAHGIKRFIYTGTIDSYASAKAGDRITGDTSVDPAIRTRNLYARSKAACEALLTALHRGRGLPLVILRPGIVIGPGSPPAHPGVGRFLSATRIDFWGDGTNKLPFVLVDDVADALALALDAPGIEGESFLVTDEPLLSARDYVEAVGARAGSRIDARPGRIWRYWIPDAVKEGAKHLIRHPNRRAASYHDWDCRAHRSAYDTGKTRERLGWRPAGTRAALIERGIDAAVDRFMR